MIHPTCFKQIFVVDNFQPKWGNIEFEKVWQTVKIFTMGKTDTSILFQQIYVVDNFWPEWGNFEIWKYGKLSEMYNGWNSSRSCLGNKL